MKEVIARNTRSTYAHKALIVKDMLDWFSDVERVRSYAVPIRIAGAHAAEQDYIRQKEEGEKKPSKLAQATINAWVAEYFLHKEGGIQYAMKKLTEDEKKTKVL